MNWLVVLGLASLLASTGSTTPGTKTSSATARCRMPASASATSGLPKIEANRHTCLA
jgi:hypothetical protein